MRSLGHLLFYLYVIEIKYKKGIISLTWITSEVIVNKVTTASNNGNFILIFSFAYTSIFYHGYFIIYYFYNFYVTKLYKKMS